MRTFYKIIEEVRLRDLNSQMTSVVNNGWVIIPTSLAYYRSRRSWSVLAALSVEDTKPPSGAYRDGPLNDWKLPTAKKE